MTYVAYGPLGPKPALAVSTDLRTWTRLGPLHFEYQPDARHRPEPVPQQGHGVLPRAGARSGRRTVVRDAASADVGPRLVPRGRGRAPAGRGHRRPAGDLDLVRAGRPTSRRTCANLVHLRNHRLVAMSEYPFEELKIGGRSGAAAGARGLAGDPPRRHRRAAAKGFDPTSRRSTTRPARCCSIRTTSTRVIARTAEPMLVPETEEETDRHRRQRGLPDRDRGGRRRALRLLRHGRLEDRRREIGPTDMNPTRRTVLGGAVAASAAAMLPTATAAAATPKGAAAVQPRPPRLPPGLGHSAGSAGPQHLSARGPLGVLWTYADRQADGSYKRIGGGTYDPVTNTYGQGAYNADDISRAAVVYLRHWELFHDASSLAAARGLLRGLTFLQSPNGNVVLWMQPDGTLNPSADPAELPDPSDSGPAYWLARTVWALGEGYAVFRRADRAFADFLKARLELAVSALERQVLDPLRPVQHRRRSPCACLAHRQRCRCDVRGCPRPGGLCPSRWVSAGSAGAGTVRRRHRGDECWIDALFGRSARCCRGASPSPTGTRGVPRCRPHSPLPRRRWALAACWTRRSATPPASRRC